MRIKERTWREEEEKTTEISEYPKDTIKTEAEEIICQKERKNPQERIDVDIAIDMDMRRPIAENG